MRLPSTSFFRKTIAGSACIIGAVALSINVNAQSDVVALYKEIMPKKTFEQTISNSERYAGYLLGKCFEVVRSKPFIQHKTSLGDWKKLGDAKTTKSLKLFDPKVSPDTFTILDLSKDKKSCWTQHDTISSPLSMQSILQALTNQPVGHFLITRKDGGEGWQERVYLFNPKDDHSAVFLYIRITFSPKPEKIIGIVREASVTETQKYDR